MLVIAKAFRIVYLLIADVIDSIQKSMYQYTMHGYVQNGYYPLMKYSIYILHKMQGWLLSSQKAVGLLTIRCFGDCPLTFILTEDEDQSTKHNVVPSPWAKIMWTIVLHNKTLVYYSLSWPDPFLDACPRSSERITLVTLALYLCPNTYHYKDYLPKSQQ